MPPVPFANVGTVWALENPQGCVGAFETSLDGKTLKLRAAPGTDWWRVPAKGAAHAKDHMSGPALVLRLPASANDGTGGFRAEVTFRGAWKDRYDQAGLILFQRFGKQRHGTSSPAPGSPRVGGAENARSSPTPQTPPRWIKTGIEIEDGIPNLSVVVADPYSDWSLMPSPIAAALDTAHKYDVPNEGKLFMILERRGPHIKIGYRINDGPVTTLREVRGFAAFSPEGSWHVGVMINQPSKEKKDGLEVEFESFDLEYF